MSDDPPFEGRAFPQKQMRELHALLVGAGALGSPVFETLGLLGIGRITVVDPDHVDPRAAERSLLYRWAGKPGENKAEALARASRTFFPGTEVQAFAREFADVGFRDVRSADIIFCCVDSDLARLEVAYVSTKLDLPVADGGLGTKNYARGRVTYFPGKHGACFGCRLTSRKRLELLTYWDGEPHSCAVGSFTPEHRSFPSTPTMAAMVGSLQVELGLRSLLDGPGGDPGHATSVEIGLDAAPAFERFEVTRSEACPFHDWEGTMIGSPGSFTATTVNRLLEAAGQGDPRRAALVLDWPLCTLAKCLDCGHAWKPMRRLAFLRHNGICPACHSSRLADQQAIRSLSYGGPWADCTLAQLGLPERHLHSVHLAPNGPGAT